MYRTHTCGSLRAEHVNETVTLAGWVQKVRNLGAMTFVDLRDRYGITQIVVEEHSPAEVRETAAKLGREFVIQVTGRVIEREAKNPKMPTGEIEVAADRLTVLNEAQTPPFTIEEHSDGGDDLRMKYRYLDLRRPPLQRNMILRHKMAQEIRRFLDSEGFLEIETPYLVGSTPEGARDFIVPSRMNPNQFYALPQSPQTLKQLLMVAGYDRYFQIVRCFRDEDLRANRQPEFTQIDMEMSFVTQRQVMDTAYGLIREVFKKCGGVKLPAKVREMPYDEAMRRFGSDKPDTRFGLELIDISDIAKNCGFQVFERAVASAGGSVRLINAKGFVNEDNLILSRRDIDALGEFVKTFKAKGLAWISVRKNGELLSAITKFMSEDTVKAILDRADAKPGDLLLFCADKDEIVYKTLGALRLHLAEKGNLIDKSKYDVLWVVDFPMFEYSEEEKRYVAVHHPFTMPHENDLDILESDPGRVRAAAYDLVINGEESGGGSLRIHDRALQKRIFNILGFSDEQIEERFGFFVNAFKYGAPPHGGLAFGFDRLVMMLAHTDNIKDVITFPKIQNASDMMTQAPTAVDKKQTDELGLRVVETV